MVKTFLPATFFLLSQTAAAATIYKCTENGKASYSDRPCGKVALELKVDGPGSPDRATLERFERQGALVQQIEGERAVREAQAAREAGRAQRAAQVQRRRCDKLRLENKWADEDGARVGREEREAARIKSRRRAEALALECPA